MRKKRSIRDVLNDLDKLKESNPDDKAFNELMEKIKAKRREDGDISEYEVLVEAGAIEAVEVPDNAVNLFPYIKEKHMRVKEALKLPENQKIIQEAKLKAEQESIYYNK